MDVDKGKNKSGESETAESKRCRITELAEQTFVRFGIKVGCRGRENGRLVSLVVGTGVA